MEEAEGEVQHKVDLLTSKFEGCFLRIVVTIHPKNLPGETRGKAPNVSWAVETCWDLLSDQYKMEDIMVTVSDADTHFMSDYYSCLSYTFATIHKRTKVIFGIPISFYENSLGVPSPVRAADMIWQITVLQQLTTGRAIRFPASTYSICLELIHEVGYWDKTADTIGEDAHMFLKCLFKTSGEARIETIWIPAGCYNVCDDTWFGSIKARYNQMYRHLWGTFDLAYIVQQSIFMRDMKFWLKALAFYEVFKVRIIPATLSFCLGIIPGVVRYFAPVYATEPYRSVLSIMGYVQNMTLIPYFVMIAYYEILHRIILNKAIARGSALPSQRRTLKHGLIDWIIFPLVSILFFTVCSIHVQIRQAFTDNITYDVAKKPESKTSTVLQEVVSGAP